MSATVAAVLKKIAIYILGDEKKRGKLFVLIGSIAAGFLGLMCLPVAVLSSMGSMEIEQPEINAEMFSDSALFESLDSEQQAQIENLKNQGRAIEDAMRGAGVRSQTIKYICHTSVTCKISMRNPMPTCLLLLRMTAI